MKLLHDVENSRWYNENGDSFASDQPAIPYGNKERVEIQLYSEVGSTNSGSGTVSEWKKYTAFNDGGYGAILATDNNFLHWYKATLQTAVASGSVPTGTAIEIATGTGAEEIAESGNLYLYDSSGNCEAIAYSSRQAITGGIQFISAAGNELENSYGAGCQADIPEMLYAEATMDGEASDPATGKFVFDFVCDSPKLRNKMQYSDIEKITDCKGLELTVFQTVGNLTMIRKRFRCPTFKITGGISDIRTGVPIPAPEENRIAALLNSYIAQGFEIQGSEDGENWIDYDEIEDFHALKWYRMRIKGSGSAWCGAIPIINGMDGKDGETPEIDPDTLHWVIGGVDTGVSAQGMAVKIQYSADAQNWHAAFASGDKFIHFSTDNGSTWGSAMKFIGDNAPNVMIQYSADGSSWHQVVTVNDYFIRFSVDNGTTWGGGSQFRAYAVRYQYGETASAVFHDNFVAGSDKFVKFSSDNGATWTNAFKFIGDDGRSFVPDATGTYANMSTYDTESQGFSYLVTSGTNEGKIYFKTADTSGEWSDGLQFTPNGLSLQYSLDGSSWHTTATVDDKYIRFSTDDGTTWSAACLFKGHSTYTYTAYASDNSGNDFSLTPSSDLDFWNWIYSDAPIAAENLTLQTFNTLGDGWRRCQGDPGITYDWLSGASVPTSSTGKNGDWYVNTATGDVYQKVSGTWTLKMNIIGPTGAGVTTRGGWLALTSYDKNDMVTYHGNAYIAARDNFNVEPGTSSDDWILYISKGDTGPAPTIGANGNWYINGVDTGLPSRGPNGITPNIGSNGNWWIGSADTGVKAEISGSYIEFSAVDSYGNYTIAGTTTVPYAVLTNAGKLYQLEKGSVIVNLTNNTVTLNVAPYLAYDGAASFSGTWRLYFAAGSIEAGDDIATLTTTAITPQHGAIFRKTLAASDAFTVNTASLTASKQVTFELHLIQPATAVSFTLPNTILWPKLEEFSSENPPPAMDKDDKLYCIVIRWDGDDLLANLAYSKAVTA